MADEKEEGKSEQPTPFKLREAKRKGSVLKSQDVLAFAAVAGVSFSALLYVPRTIEELLLSWRRLFAAAGKIDTPLLSLLPRYFAEMLYGIAPLFVAIVLATVLASFMQSGFVFSAHPLKPDFNRLNPIQGFKKLFSKKILIELVKTFIKIALFALIVGWLLHALIIDAAHMGALSGKQIFDILDWYGTRLWIVLLSLLLIFAGMDYFLSARQYNQQMKMSRREIREEFKRQEGDPMIRRKLKELRNELQAKTRSFSAVGDADFVLTNPTHLAIAIRYRPEIIDAPVVVAKGAGKQAERIRQIAAKHRIPVVERRLLARRIFFRTKIGSAIEPEFFADLARVMRHTGVLNKRRKTN